MREATSNLTARTWWVSRALIYWIPLLAILAGAVQSAQGQEGSLRSAVAIGLVFIVFAEQVLFSFVVSIDGGLLTYRKGLLIRSGLSIDKDQVKSFALEPLFPNASLQSARIVVELRDGATAKINLSSFKPADTRMILDWLGQ
jgi:hypothetical protein